MQARGQLLQLLGMSNGGNNEGQESAKTLTIEQKLKLLTRSERNCIVCSAKNMALDSLHTITDIKKRKS